jgi:MSHA biogenesis protein MshK
MAFSLKLAAFLSISACSLAWAQGTPIADPTRPPAAFSAAAGGAAVAQGEAAGGRLSSVLLPRRGGKPSAVIDGKNVRLGEKIGDSRLVRVTETEVTLAGPAGKETLLLTPDVVKKTLVTQKTARQRKKETP